MAAKCGPVQKENHDAEHVRRRQATVGLPPGTALTFVKDRRIAVEFFSGRLRRRMQRVFVAYACRCTVGIGIHDRQFRVGRHSWKPGTYFRRVASHPPARQGTGCRNNGVLRAPRPRHPCCPRSGNRRPGSRRLLLEADWLQAVVIVAPDVDILVEDRLVYAAGLHELARDVVQDRAVGPQPVPAWSTIATHEPCSGNGTHRRISARQLPNRFPRAVFAHMPPKSLISPATRAGIRKSTAIWPTQPRTGVPAA